MPVALGAAQRRPFNGDPDGAMKAHVAALNKKCHACSKRASTAVRMFMRVVDVYSDASIQQKLLKRHPDGNIPVVEMGEKYVLIDAEYACQSCTPAAMKALAEAERLNPNLLYHVDMGPKAAPVSVAVGKK